MRAKNRSVADSTQLHAAVAAARRLRPAAAGHGPLILLAGGQRFDRVKGGDASQESFGSGFSAAARGGGSSSEAASYRLFGGCELQTARRLRASNCSAEDSAQVQAAAVAARRLRIAAVGRRFCKLEANASTATATADRSAAAAASCTGGNELATAMMCGSECLAAPGPRVAASTVEDRWDGQRPRPS